jgi:Ca-activated chloride channel family protein
MIAFLLRPEGLALLLLGPAVWWFIRVRDLARGRRLAGVLGPRVTTLAESPQRRRWRVRRVAFGMAVALAIFAALGPTLGASAGDLEWGGVDLVVCLDVSRSMLARDLVPDRLSRAQEQIRALAERTRGDRLALVLFAGEARLRVPLTTDAASLVALADAADPSDVTVGGTDLGAALTTALVALEGGDGRPQAIVLLTDGEDLGGQGARVARDCAARGIAVHGVGFGSPDGSRIALARQEGTRYVRDRQGREVVSTLDVEGLTALTGATGGRFVSARTSAQPLPDLYASAVLPTARAGHVASGPQRRKDRFQWVLLAAFLLFMLDLWLVDRTRA